MPATRIPQPCRSVRPGRRGGEKYAEAERAEGTGGEGGAATTPSSRRPPCRCASRDVFAQRSFWENTYGKRREGKDAVTAFQRKGNAFQPVQRQQALW